MELWNIGGGKVHFETVEILSFTWPACQDDCFMRARGNRQRLSTAIPSAIGNGGVPAPDSECCAWVLARRLHGGPASPSGRPAPIG
jgi:hypothetical protein